MSVDIGHNSIHASPEEYATLVKRANRVEELEGKVKEIDGKLRNVTRENKSLRDNLIRANGTFATISTIGDTDLSATAKTMATHLAIAAMNSPDGDGRVSRDQLQKWASLKDRQSVPRVLDELVSARLLEISKRPMGGNRQYTIRLASDDDLQSAVEALRSTTASNVVVQNCAAARQLNRGSNPHSAHDRGSHPHSTEGQTLTQRSSEGRTLTQLRAAPSLRPNEGHTLIQTAEIADIQTAAQYTDSERTLLPKKDNNNTLTKPHTSGLVAESVCVWAEDNDHAELYRSLQLTGDRFFVRHPHFTINIEAVRLANPGKTREEVLGVVLGEALQWATDIAAGKDPTKVVPQSVQRWLAAAVQRGNIRKQVGDAQVARASKSPQTVPSWHNRVDPRGSMRDA